MGQTLTHGVYLPDEGERNCYSGLAANWQLLDGAVGTVAEHTSQIAGKAPAVHTHTKSDITDFPSYGNTAGTICEGNDSRLSDARTPVAHTHTKSDVTDLLNSNFIPSANNSYDLGSSSYQWNNLYAKNYFYNGVAWGLDKANTWTQSQTISINLPVFTLQDTIGVRNTTPANARNLTFSFLDKNGDSYGFINRQHKAGTGTHLHQVSISNGTYDYRVQFYLYTDGKSDYIPSNDGVINLGTTNNKWKTLNGINPGALSLPSENASSVNLDPTNWVTDGSNYNSYTPPSDGWLAIQVHSADITDLTGQYVFAGRATGGTDYWPQGGLGVLKMVDDRNAKLIGQIFIPVISGKNYHITIKINKTQTEGSIIYARFYPCLGNV